MVRKIQHLLRKLRIEHCLIADAGNAVMIQGFYHWKNFLRLFAAVLIEKAAEHEVAGRKGLQIFLNEFRHQFIVYNAHAGNLTFQSFLSGNQFQIVEALQFHQISYGKRHNDPPV